MPKDTELLSIGAAAERLGVSQKTLRKWADGGQIRVVKLPSGFRRFEPAEIERMRHAMGFADETPAPAGR